MSRSEWSDEQIENARLAILVNLAAKGLAYRVIGRVLGVSKTTVCRILKTMPAEKRLELESLGWWL